MESFLLLQDAKCSSEHQVLGVAQRFSVNMLLSARFNGAVGGLMETLICFKEPLQLERDAPTRSTWRWLTPPLHTHTAHIHTCIPAHTTTRVSPEELSLLRDRPGWKNTTAETPEESPTPTPALPTLLHIQLGISLFMRHREENLLPDQSHRDFVARLLLSPK